jgi:hypothetical protein
MRNAPKRIRLRDGSSASWGMVAGHAKSLPIFLQGFHSLFTIRKRTCDRRLQSSIPISEFWTALFRYRQGQIRHERVHAPHDLHAGSTVGTDFIKGQEIIPGGKWNHEAQLGCCGFVDDGFEGDFVWWPRRVA